MVSGPGNSCFAPRPCPIIASRQYRIFDGDRQTCLRFPSLEENGAVTARDTLRSSLDLRVRQHESEDKLAEEPFCETVTQIWHSLGVINRGLQDAELHHERAKCGAPGYLHGVEMMDIINMDNNPRIQEAQVDQPWTHIAKDHFIVLLCGELQPPIVCYQPEKLCKT
jgi:hypothetical protein